MTARLPVLLQSDRYTLSDQVSQFHEAMGCPPDPPIPCVPADDRVRLRLRLITEEYIELVRSLLERLPLRDGYLEKAEGYIWDAIEFCPVGVDLPELADACADLDYVVEGTRLEFGIDGAPIADAVHAANMAKLGGGKRADGKVIKPPGWQAPDIACELVKQGWEREP